MTRRGAGLEAEQVVGVALELLDEVGLEGLTVRRLAERLGVANPALYWHFRGKQELVDRMAARLLRGVFAGPAAPWDRWLARTARALRRALLARRDGARLVASADLSHSEMTQGVHRAVQLLVEAGFKRRDARVGVVTLLDFTLGATFEEQADPARGRGPTGAMFEGGLRLLLDGLALRRR